MSEEKNLTIETEREEGMLSSEQLMGILENKEEEMKKTAYGSDLHKGVRGIFDPGRRFFREMKKEIGREGVCGLIADRIFPLLYFQGWPKMWKMREEQREREILYASGGKMRNLLEGALCGITGGIAGETTDYERRFEQSDVKKEEEELMSDDEGYLRDELKKALAASKLSRAEACVRKLEDLGNLNEIMRDEKLGKEIRNWDDDGVYDWLTETFGKRRAHYILMDFSEHFAKGHCMCKGMVEYDSKIGEFIRRGYQGATEEERRENARKARGLYAAYESSKLQVEGEWRALSHLSVADEDYSRKGYIIRPSEFLKARLTMVSVEACDRGIGRANEKVVARMYLMAKQIEEYIESKDFDWYIIETARLEGLERPTPEEIKTQRKIARTFLGGIKAKRTEIGAKIEGFLAKEMVNKMKGEGKKEEEMREALREEEISEKTIKELLPEGELLPEEKKTNAKKKEKTKKGTRKKKGTGKKPEKKISPETLKMLLAEAEKEK